MVTCKVTKSGWEEWPYLLTTSTTIVNITPASPPIIVAILSDELLDELDELLDELLGGEDVEVVKLGWKVWSCLVGSYVVTHL